MISKKNKIIAKKEVFCTSVISKTIGLMFHRKPKDTGYIFIFNKEENPVKIAIHNMFVFFSIDVIYLDSHKKIVDMCEHFKPFSLLFVPKQKAKYIIEFQSGVIEKNNLKIGDVLKF